MIEVMVKYSIEERPGRKPQKIDETSGRKRYGKLLVQPLLQNLLTFFLTTTNDVNDSFLPVAVSTTDGDLILHDAGYENTYIFSNFARAGYFN